MKPFKQGDWLIVVEGSLWSISENFHLHMAKEDPKENKRMGSGWSYRCDTGYSDGKNKEIDSAHFRKATKEDLRKEAERLRKEAFHLLKKAAKLYDVVDCT